ncbi:hypothetical protein C8R43DRAFT_1103765 [Mycena crocata]|nr:hypothetical protein C8R43DRAFT_1103765 [Mycena crocata]
MSTTAPTTTIFPPPRFSRTGRPNSTSTSSSRGRSSGVSGYQYYVIGALLGIFFVGVLLWVRWRWWPRRQRPLAVARKGPAINQTRPQIFDVYLDEAKEREVAIRLQPLAAFSLDKNDTTALPLGPSPAHNTQKDAVTSATSHPRAGIAVLVAMPGVRAIPHADDDGEDIPHVDIGTFEELLDMGAFEELVHDHPDIGLRETQPFCGFDALLLRLSSRIDIASFGTHLAKNTTRLWRIWMCMLDSQFGTKGLGASHLAARLARTKLAVSHPVSNRARTTLAAAAAASPPPSLPASAAAAPAPKPSASLRASLPEPRRWNRPPQTSSSFSHIAQQSAKAPFVVSLRHAAARAAAAASANPTRPARAAGVPTRPVFASPKSTSIPPVAPQSSSARMGVKPTLPARASPAFARARLASHPPSTVPRWMGKGKTKTTCSVSRIPVPVGRVVLFVRVKSSKVAPLASASPSPALSASSASPPAPVAVPSASPDVSVSPTPTPPSPAPSTCPLRSERRASHGSRGTPRRSYTQKGDRGVEDREKEKDNSPEAILERQRKRQGKLADGQDGLIAQLKGRLSAPHPALDDGKEIVLREGGEASQEDGEDTARDDEDAHPDTKTPKRARACPPYRHARRRAPAGVHPTGHEHWWSRHSARDAARLSRQHQRGVPALRPLRALDIDNGASEDNEANDASYCLEGEGEREMEAGQTPFGARTVRRVLIPALDHGPDVSQHGRIRLEMEGLRAQRRVAGGRRERVGGGGGEKKSTEGNGMSLLAMGMMARRRKEKENENHIDKESGGACLDSHGLSVFTAYLSLGLDTLLDMVMSLSSAALEIGRRLAKCSFAFSVVESSLYSRRVLLEDLLWMAKGGPRTNYLLLAADMIPPEFWRVSTQRKIAPIFG